MHLTVRMAWHDNNWDGKVCCNPESNTYCTGAHSLLSGRIEKRKNTAFENKETVRGEYVSKNFNPEDVPPCYWSINAFSDKGFPVTHHHAFKYVNHTISDKVKPYSVFSWPFKLSFVHTDEGKAINGNYWPDLDQRINDFIKKFKKNESVIFFYANYDNPVSADDMKYLLLGCSVIDKVENPKDFPFTEKELQNFRKVKEKNGKRNIAMKNFPTLNWTIQFSHQNDKSVLLPYREYIKHIEEFPEEYKKLDDFKVVIDEPSLIRGFKYVAMDIDDDKCLYLLYKIRKAIFKIREHNRQVIHNNLDEEEKRIDNLIKMVWEKRGIYPSLQKILKYFQKKESQKLAEAINKLVNKDFDLLQCFERIIKDDIPKELNEFSDDLEDLIEIPQFKRNFKSYLKLALFNLTEHQINRIIKNYNEEIIRGLESNPYLIYEQYEPDPPKNELDIPDLIDEPIDVFKIDIGMLPDTRFIRRHRKIQNISESSPERTRSIIIEYLWGLEGAGHTYDNLKSIIKNIKEYPLIYHTDTNIDENGILDMEREYRDHFQERLHIENVEQEKYIYLKVLYNAEIKIKERITLLLGRKPHKEKGLEYKPHIENSIIHLKKRVKDFDENLFRAERNTLFENVFSSSLYLLTGKPGSGKTYETSQIINNLKSIKQGFEILAPTGKAALRISENVKNKTGIDIKANTIDRFIYEHGFWWAYEDWNRLYNLPEDQKLTVTNLIIDESSMIDLQKLYILFSIVKFNKEYPKRVIFVGDENQLPPIGFGKPFQDIINYVISNENTYSRHYIHLSTNCRQENDLNIIKLAEAFTDKTRYFEESLNMLYKKGKVSEGLEVNYWKTKEQLFSFINKKVESLLIDELKTEYLKIDDLIKEIDNKSEKDYLIKRKGLIGDSLKNGTVINQFNLVHGLYENGYVPFIDYDFRKNLNLENIQILSPYRPGFYGVLGLNKMIQSSFRNISYKDTNTMYYHADKLIRISNYYIGYGRDKKLILSNGSIGVVNNHKGGEIKYYFRDADNVLKWVDDEEQFELGYAITVHKSQGSDFSNVFLIIPNKINLLNKELIYTALTRSKSKLFLFIYDNKENLLVKSKNISALLMRQSSIFEKPEDKRIKYYPRKGEKPVKSKGEYIIHKALQRSGLKFQYENELRLNKLNYPIHPDFEIELDDKTKIYWEHLGKLDTRKYFNDWIKRKDDYNEHNLFDNVVTTDDLDGIKDDIVEKVIDDIRNNKLKSTPKNKFSKHHYQLY